jgi:hypothetical protein
MDVREGRVCEKKRGGEGRQSERSNLFFSSSPA